MPSEKFFQTPDVMDGPGGMFEVVWGEGEDEVEIYLYAWQHGKDGRPKNIRSFAPDRDDLNRMIRALRRARNAKYGSDE